MNNNSSDHLPLAAPDTEEIEKQRIEQAWRYAAVACLIWVSITGLLWLRDYQSGALICCIQTTVMVLLMFLHRGLTEQKSHRRFTNLFLGFSCATVFLVAVNHPDIKVVLFFLPIGIVMAAQVLGPRGAVPWFLVNLAAFIIHPIIYRGDPSSWSAVTFNTCALNCGVASFTFLSCFQSENLYRKRTDKLISLSERLHRLATTDSLTGLMNRHQFQNQLATQLEQAKSASGRLALMMIDMNGFKAINDNLGHHIGDATLVEVASRLKTITPHVYRLGGDEFCVLVNVTEDFSEAQTLTESIHDSLCSRYWIEDANFQLGASIGVAIYPDNAPSPSELLSYADAAMYHAKENRLGICGYEDDQTNQLVAIKKIQGQLSSALDRNEYFLMYQPQVELETGKVTGVEALLRWSRDKQTISPNDFIPLLEKTRLIIPVGKWVIREACRQLRDWTADGYDICISINVSVVQFQDPDFAVLVNDAIDEFGIDARKLDFEVTEGLLIEDIDAVINRLRQLKKTGATISIDDFGTGYSSLSYLRKLPLDRLKIDREFIKDIPSTDDGTIVASIILLAKSLGLRVLAEGVETKKQLEFLRQHQCDEYQGYLMSNPCSAAKATELLSRNACLNSVR